MNYLAHIFLAGENPEAQLGGMLGDFIKPGSEPQYSAVILQEIRLHRMIDTFTDSHAEVMSAKRRFKKGSRRFSGIILDLLYDHFLASKWNNYSEVSLGEFTRKFYRYLKTTEFPLPERLQVIAPELIRLDWLGSYAEYEGFVRSVHGLAQRLSKGREEMVAGLDEVQDCFSTLQSGFEQFFPELQFFVQSRRSQLAHQVPSDER